jgi:hypothetical protein
MIARGSVRISEIGIKIRKGFGYTKRWTRDVYHKTDRLGWARINRQINEEIYVPITRSTR